MVDGVVDKVVSRRKRLTDLLDSRFMARLDGLDVTTRKLLAGKMQGERRSKRRGQSVEFADHRPYVAGDDIRFIDWNIYGRLEQLFLKLFMEEQDLTVHVLVDGSGSAAYGEPSKEVFIKRLAAALGYVGLVHNNRVTMTVFGEKVRGQLAHMRGRGYLNEMAELLLGVQADGVSDFDRVCKQVAAGRVGVGVMIVLSDFLFKEGYESGLRRLIGRNYDVYAVQVLSRQELEPELSGDLKLVDVEDDDTAEITANGALLKYYKRTLSAYCNELKGFCRQRGAGYVLASSADSVELLVLNTLRRMGMVC